MSKTVAIVQSNYIPWKGYFDLIRQADEFILYDDAQYTRRDWRNRNRIKTPAGVQWLTIPVEVKGKYFQKVKDTRISDQTWGSAHWQRLCQSYARAPYFRGYRDRLELLYRDTTATFLSDINFAFLQCLCDLMGIRTRLTWSMDYRFEAPDPTGRLLEMCLQAGATHYLSGPTARAYLDEPAFQKAGVQVEYIDYGDYAKYPQLYPPFDHYVSILDALFMVGPSILYNLRRLPHAA